MIDELALLLATIRLATPLALAALGELVAERSGVLNIGIEGMMLTGACAAYFIATSSSSAVLGIAGAGLAGALAAAIFAWFVLLRAADPIVSGTALNLLALGVTGSIYRAASGAPTEVAEVAPRVGSLLGIHAFVWIALVLALLVTLLLTRTRLGLVIRAAGESAVAAHAQGVRVVAIRMGCTLFGGLCAGVAGATLVLWSADRFVESMSGGRGFIALALVLFGGYRVPWILAGAVLFGFASALQFRLQASELDIPYNLLLMLPYVLTLAVLAVFSSRTRAPADLGRPFLR